MATLFFKSYLEHCRKILPFSLISAFVFTALTNDLSRVYPATISISAIGSKSAESNASVVWLSYPRNGDLQRGGVEIQKSKGWEIKDGILLSTRNQPAELNLHGFFPMSSRLDFFRTEYSGQAAIEINGIVQDLDLFSKTSSSRNVELKKYFAGVEPSTAITVYRLLVPFLKNFLLLIVLSFWLAPIYRRILIPRVHPYASVPHDRKIYLIVAAVIIFLLCLVAFYPGVVTDDSVDQYAQAVQFRFNDWHPPIMAALWSLTDKIIPGPGGMFVLHLAMLCCSAYLLSCAALMQNKKFFFLPLLAVLMPTIVCLSFYILKDVSLAYSLLFAFSMWYYWQNQGTINRAKLLIILVIIFYASSVRSNGLLAAIPLIFMIVSDFTSKKNAVWSTVFICCLFVFGNYYFTYRVLHSGKSYISQAIMAHDLKGIYKRTQRNYFPEDYLNRNRLDQLMKQFDCSNSSATTWIEQPFLVSSEHSFVELRTQWKQAILDHPAAYLSQRSCVYQAFLFSKDFWLFNYQQPESAHFPKPFLLGKSLAAGMYTKGGMWLKDNFTILFQAATYMLINTFLLIVSIRRKNRIVVAMSVSSLFYLCSFFPFGPGADYRYNYWPMIAFLLSAFTISDFRTLRKQASEG